MRLALWHSGLGRDGPGLLLHDIRRQHPETAEALSFAQGLDADVLVLLDIDHDLNGVAVAALAQHLAYSHWLAPMPNTGIQRGLDLDRDARLAEAEDALGHGRFPGAGGIAVLSRWPLRLLADHAAALWADAAPERWPIRADGSAYFTRAEGAVLPLWGVTAFELDVTPPQGPPLRLLVWHADPPAFDGAEGRNRLRNAAQVEWLAARIDGLATQGAFVLMGNTNLDPARGNGERGVMRALLDHPAIRDPLPRAPHPGPGAPDEATAWWPGGPGALRVSYVLPDRRLRLRDTGLRWPAEARHAAAWVELGWPPP